MNNKPYDHGEAPIRRPPSPPRTRTNLASCIVATIFLAFVAILLLIVFFTLFRPKPPKLATTAVQLPAFSASRASGAVNFTFSQYLSVGNPNRDAFSHYRSTLQLFYAGSLVGAMFIPAGSVPARHTVFMSATFDVGSFAFAPSGGPPGGFRYESMEVESWLTMEGRVRILRFFTHRVVAKAGCLVEISVLDGSVVGFHC